MYNCLVGVCWIPLALFVGHQAAGLSNFHSAARKCAFQGNKDYPQGCTGAQCTLGVLFARWTVLGRLPWQHHQGAPQGHQGSPWHPGAPWGCALGGVPLGDPWVVPKSEARASSHQKRNVLETQFEHVCGDGDSAQPGIPPSARVVAGAACGDKVVVGQLRNRGDPRHGDAPARVSQCSCPWRYLWTGWGGAGALVLSMFDSAVAMFDF